MTKADYFVIDDIILNLKDLKEKALENFCNTDSKIYQIIKDKSLLSHLEWICDDINHIVLNEELKEDF